MPESNVVATFRWTRQYAVGLDAIDLEHRSIFALAEEMHRAMLAGKGKESLEALLTGLVDYTCCHFSHEEALMERIGYPGLEGHKREHEELRAKLRMLRDRSRSGEATMTLEVMQFLIEWLERHTIASDRQIGDYVRAAGTTA